MNREQTDVDRVMEYCVEPTPEDDISPSRL